MKRKVLIIGLDGAGFQVMGEWLKDGSLPTLAKIVREGTKAELMSTIPPLTSPAWPCMVTGKNPGKLGVFNFVAEEGKMNLISSRSIKGKTVWNILSERDMKVGVVNVPITYPPQKINGYMVTGMFTPSKSSTYTYPNSLAQELGEYEIDVNHVISFLKGDKDTFFETLGKVAEKRKNAVLKIMDKFDWDFFMVVFTGSDRAQHVFWNEKEEIKRYYQKVDRAIAEIMEKAGKDTNVLIVSDHGFISKKMDMNVNELLRTKGLLAMKRGWKARKDTLRILVKMKQKILPYTNIIKLFNIKQDVVQSTFLKGIEWKRTKAYTYISGMGFYVNLKGRERNGIVEKEDYDKVRDQIIGALASLKDPETGKQIVRGLKKEELYNGPHMENAPDVVYDILDEKYDISTILYKKGKGLISPSTRMSSHAKKGIFLAYGPDIAKGKTIEANIVDIIPTVLHILGLPVSKEMDGKVLKGALASDAMRREVKFEKEAEAGAEGEGVYTKEEEAKIKERLKALGYM